MIQALNTYTTLTVIIIIHLIAACKLVQSTASADIELMLVTPVWVVPPAFTWACRGTSTCLRCRSCSPALSCGSRCLGGSSLSCRFCSRCSWRWGCHCTSQTLKKGSKMFTTRLHLLHFRGYYFMLRMSDGIIHVGVITNITPVLWMVLTLRVHHYRNYQSVEGSGC